MDMSPVALWNSMGGLAKGVVVLMAIMSIYSIWVMVERFIRGSEHRLLVVGGQVVAAARGEVIWPRSSAPASSNSKRSAATSGRPIPRSPSRPPVRAWTAPR